MRIAINGNRHQEGHFEAIEKLVDNLLRRGDDVVMAEPFFNYLTSHLGDRFGLGIDYIPLTRQPDADLAICIGGDGAFLKTARWIGNQATPIAGINTGHLGYLSAFTFENEEQIYSYLLTGDFCVEQRSVIRADIDCPEGAPAHPHPSCLFALNEIALTRSDSAAMLAIDLKIDRRASLNYKGDGLILATPTGSTAYNLSVGGPILDPSLEGWVISPIAAHSLSVRPLVVSDSSTIEISVDTRGTGYRLAADGFSVTLPLNSRLKIHKASYTIGVVQMPGHTFTDTLRDKLGMGN